MVFNNLRLMQTRLLAKMIKVTIEFNPVPTFSRDSDFNIKYLGNIGGGKNV